MSGKYYPTFVDFNVLDYDIINDILQRGRLDDTGNMFPVKCHKFLIDSNEPMKHSIFSPDVVP